MAGPHRAAFAPPSVAAGGGRVPPTAGFLSDDAPAAPAPGPASTKPAWSWTTLARLQLPPTCLAPGNLHLEPAPAPNLRSLKPRWVEEAVSQPRSFASWWRCLASGKGEVRALRGRGRAGPREVEGEAALSERSLASEVDGTLASAMLFTWLPSELHHGRGASVAS